MAPLEIQEYKASKVVKEKLTDEKNLDCRLPKTPSKE